MALRPYQQEAVDAAVAWMRRSVMPGLLELATGAGKSHVAAALAEWFHATSGKKVLCLQPSKELTEQNFAKFVAAGGHASIFSASAGRKDLRHQVVYGTPGTVKNALGRFGDQFGLVIVDEAHGITPTIRMIIDAIRASNARLRVIGMTATPYRTGTGYIYQYTPTGQFVGENEARNPYFNTLLYSIQTRELVSMGFLTPAHADPDSNAANYAARGLAVTRVGTFDRGEVERVFEGRGRLTATIVADVVAQSAGRDGVMLFAATVAHAKEIMESLPPGSSRMLAGDVNTEKAEREELIADFKALKFKFLVSVGMLTTGFDAPHVSVIAVLRATESPGLFQQIIGRGLRLHPSKSDCLVLDYAENIDRFGLFGDLFAPEIRVTKGKGGGEPLRVCCPLCAFENEFAPRPNPDDFGLSADGYFLDLAGNPIACESGPMPSHFGRRCTGQTRSLTEPGTYERCEYRWTAKECPECAHPNDIAARYCEACKAEIVDPNEKLRADFARVKRDPYSATTDRVLQWLAAPTVTKTGKDAIVCTYTTEYRTFKAWFLPEATHPAAVRAWRSLSAAVYSGHVAPSAAIFMQHLDKGAAPVTVTSRRDPGSNFYTVLAHNEPEDVPPC